MRSRLRAEIVVVVDSPTIRPRRPSCACAKNTSAAPGRQRVRPRAGERDPLGNRPRRGADRRRDHGRRLRRSAADRRARAPGRPRGGRRRGLALHGRRPAGGRARFKTFLSRTAGQTLRLFAQRRAPAMRRTRSRRTGARSSRRSASTAAHGFEIGLELTAKARRLRLPVAEIPTIWLDRTAGSSQFRLASWIPKYLRWYRFAFGPRLTVAQLRGALRARPPER